MRRPPENGGPENGRPENGRPERGSTLLLFPAAILIMVALAAMTVDSSVAFLAQRELANAAAAAANDAAAAVSDSAFYQQDRVELSAATVEAVAVDRVYSVIDQGRHHGLSVEVQALAPAGAGCSWTVRVRASSQVDPLFAKALPGGSRRIDVKAQATATPREQSSLC